jgi:hypothetical protein
MLRRSDTLTEQVIACASKEVRCLKIQLKQNQNIFASHFFHILLLWPEAAKQRRSKLNEAKHLLAKIQKKIFEQ